jgi:tripartite-type tricarboxylate transporter receptor subunit TctC
MRFQCLFAAVVLSGLVGLPQAFAQSYPSRPIRVIVPSAAGGTLDIIARSVVQKMSESLKQPIIVDNRPGASGIIALELAAKAPADGYTLVLGTSGTFATNVATYAKLPFDVVRDFAPISIVTESTFVLAVHPSLPATTLQEFVALAKARPDQITYGSFGIGSISHFLTESFSQLAGVKLVHVPYKSAPDSLNALVGGHVMSSVDALTVVWPHVRAKRMRVLAVGDTKRSALAPDIPTFSEAGFPSFTAIVWYGLFAPANTPREIVTKLNGEIIKSLATAETRERLESIGLLPIGSTPEQLAAQIRGDIDKFVKVAREAKIRAE